MSLKYISNIEDKEDQTGDAMPTTVASTDSQPPTTEPTPKAEAKEDKLPQKRTTPMPKEELNAAAAVDVLISNWKKNQQPSEEDLKHQEKRRKVEIFNSYAWTGVQIAAALCFLALAVSYLKMANVAKLNALKA